MRTVIVLLFVFICSFVGVHSAKNQKISKEDEMNLAGRKMGWFTLGTSAAASGCSAFAFVGMASQAYTYGVSMLWYPAMACTWSWAIFYIIGKRLRRMSIKTGTTTIVDYLGERLKDSEGVFRLTATIIVVSVMVVYMASNFSAIIGAFESYLGMPVWVGLLIGGGCVALYSAVGGFRSVVLVDTIQGIAMLLGSGVLFLFIILRSGGIDSLLQQAASIDYQLVDIKGGRTVGSFLICLIGWFGSGFMGIGNPHISVRPMGMKNDSDMRIAGIWCFVINMWVLYMGTFSGLAARVWLGKLDNPDLAYAQIVSVILGPVFGGVVIAGIISATMSTISSQLLVAQSEFTTMLFRYIKRGKISDETRILASRILIVILTILSALLSVGKTGLVYFGNLFAWAGLGCAFGPILVISLYWKGITRNGAVVGMLTGVIVVVFWKILGLSEWLYEGMPGMLASTLLTIIVSKITTPPDNADELVKFAAGNPF